MNNYYYQIATVVYDQFGIDPFEKIMYKNYYLTVQDYLITVSIDDEIKNILALLKMLPDKNEAQKFINSAITYNIQSVLLGENGNSKYRLKEINKIF
ncbi:MAG: hypothetical protein WAW77_15560 [Caldibacillus thermoamylovorans]|uniref:hypothetical protein n=1 Tax=Caldifermentibacillus hisashii TaxID=996558 RepID=UPI002E2469E5|nr:hypothetical protein [Caldibacillus thermoamylovorans]MED3643992.1 hypothetical protein [Caldifermentibacillus hisashii]